MSIKRKTTANQQAQRKPKAMLTSHIRSVGNSKGIILSNSLLQAAGLAADAKIIIEATDGIITIAQAKTAVNTDLKSWDRQFKKAIKAGAKPEKDLFEGLANEFDKTEW